jgi:hypothetical protein
MFLAVKLATLLYPSGPAHDVNRCHLFVLLTNPFGPAMQVLMVPICTVVAGCDTTCIIKTGEHAFVQTESYASYGWCRVEPEKKLVTGVSKGQFADKGPVSQTLYSRITNGLRKSPFTKPFALTFFNDAERAAAISAP